MIDIVNINISKFTPSLVLIGGASGVGKTLIVDTLIKKYPNLYSRPISFTSRSKRPGEGETEYKFTSRDKINEMFEKGDLLTIDDVYGNLYAIRRDSITAVFNKNQIAIKEVHPSNHAKIKAILKNTISVLLIPGNVPDEVSHQENHLRDERKLLDQDYYSSLDPLAFDIAVRVDLLNPHKTAEHLHSCLHSFTSTQHIFPSPIEIDRINRDGYQKAAPEFQEDLRITTKNFHDLSLPYFHGAIDTYLNKGKSCIEIGVGQGWLTKLLPLSDIKYVGVDISSNMIRNEKRGLTAVSSARFIDQPDQSFDIVLASLADPYFYPGALCEINRILKPNGIFIFSTPSRIWSGAIRKNEDEQRTSFVLHDGTKADVYSFTFTMSELRDLLSLCKFSILQDNVIHGNNHLGEKISPAITAAANNLEIDISQLPIVNFVIARKRG